MLPQAPTCQTETSTAAGPSLTTGANNYTNHSSCLCLWLLPACHLVVRISKRSQKLSHNTAYLQPVCCLVTKLRVQTFHERYSLPTFKTIKHYKMSPLASSDFVLLSQILVKNNEVFVLRAPNNLKKFWKLPAHMRH
jgi:hypothetical protein